MKLKARGRRWVYKFTSLALVIDDVLDIFDLVSKESLLIQCPAMTLNLCTEKIPRKPQ